MFGWIRGSGMKNEDGFVKSPSAALRFKRSLGGQPLRDLIPQFSRALHLELFTEPSGGDYFRDLQ